MRMGVSFHFLLKHKTRMSTTKHVFVLSPRQKKLCPFWGLNKNIISKSLNLEKNLAIVLRNCPKNFQF